MSLDLFALGLARVIKKALLLLVFFVFLPDAMAIIPTPVGLEKGFLPIAVVTKRNLPSFELESSQTRALIQNFCKKITQEYKKYHWDEDPCFGVEWEAKLKSRSGHPLIYAQFGQGADVSLFFGGVHPDEVTTINLAFRFARYLQENKELYKEGGIKVIIAPLVNPDGFLRQEPLRTNGEVDVNRNFFTLDWYEQAQKNWQQKKSSNPRYFPGYFPNSEIETVFQVKLIEQFLPLKIFSLHAPLGFLDYDGPSDKKAQDPKRTKQFVYQVSKKTNNYPIVDYSFYPGSLGNFAGIERSLPTITLELKSVNPQRAKEYWETFLPGFLETIHYKFNG